MSISSKAWSRLALLGLAAMLVACTEEAPGLSGGVRLPKATPTPAASDEPTPRPTPTPSPTPSPTPTPTLVSLQILPSEVTLGSDPAATNRGTNLAVVGQLSNNQQVTPTVTWSVTPSGLVTVNSGGYVSTVANAPSGTATVKATSGSLEATALVHVTGKAVTVTSVELSSSGLTLYAPAADGIDTAGLATSSQLVATVTMSDASTTHAVTWSSSNEQVATVTSSGLVTSVGAGSATLTAQSTLDPSQRATCPVTVKAQGLVDVTVE